MWLVDEKSFKSAQLMHAPISEFNENCIGYVILSY